MVGGGYVLHHSIYMIYIYINRICFSLLTKQPSIPSIPSSIFILYYILVILLEKTRKKREIA